MSGKRSAPAVPGSEAGWGQVVDAMIHPAWLVAGRDLRIVAANAAASLLCGVAAGTLRGRAVLDFAVTPEDQEFWREAQGGVAGPLQSDSLIRSEAGKVIPVVRRVSRVPGAAGAALYLVAIDDRTEAERREREFEQALAELQAALDSLHDGILLLDLRGTIRNFNRRFADLWELPRQMVERRDDGAVLDWMCQAVVDPAGYMRRLAAMEDAALLRASDVLTLRTGRVLERVALPQFSRGRPIGRLFLFREVRPAIRPARAKH